jgi:hypothetical protein
MLICQFPNGTGLIAIRFPRRLEVEIMAHKTSQELIARARAHKMTPSERRDQRVSLVMGMRGKASTLTREKVTTILAEVEGL